MREVLGGIPTFEPWESHKPLPYLQIRVPVDAIHC